jgi:Protein of unknown function (DUF3106)
LPTTGWSRPRGKSRRELILATASERWDALSPEERQSWLAGRQERAEQRQALASRLTPEQQAEVRARVASMTPEQRAAARARLDDSPGSAGARDRIGDASAGLGSARDTSRFDDHMVSHPTPRRAIGSSPRFRTAGSRGGRR